MVNSDVLLLLLLLPHLMRSCVMVEFWISFPKMGTFPGPHTLHSDSIQYMHEIGVTYMDREVNFCFTMRQFVFVSLLFFTVAPRPDRLATLM
jgi:hypothetical protein